MGKRPGCSGDGRGGGKMHKSAQGTGAGMKLELTDRIVVVGASLAGLRTIEALRDAGHQGEIVALSAEAEMPYDRPPLSKKFLKGEWDEDRLSLRRSGFEDLDVDWRLGCTALALDPAAREVQLESGDRLAYGGLVLATGSRPRALPGVPSLDGVHMLRTLADARALRAQFLPGSRLVVIGAGFIGMEVAASAREAGLEVTVLEALPSALLRGLGAELGSWVSEHFVSRGVDVRCGVGVKSLLGDSRIRGVELADGSQLDADVVVVGIGVAPVCDWLEGSGVELRDGVVCDASGGTSLPDVVAVGDVARWYNPAYGKALRYEHWTSAVEQSAPAAKRLLHGEAGASPLSQVPYVWTDLFDLRLAMVGELRESDQMCVGQGSLDEGRFLAVFGREGRLCGAVASRRPRPLNACRALIEKGASLDEAVAAHL